MNDKYNPIISSEIEKTESRGRFIRNLGWIVWGGGLIYPYLPGQSNRIWSTDPDTELHMKKVFYGLVVTISSLIPIYIGRNMMADDSEKVVLLKEI